MTNTIIYKAENRGHADHGWLNARHSFSFAGYYDPERVHFGALRVLNDDTIAPGMGFGMHPHDNMEIITIPLEGELEHRDSMGNTGVIGHNEIQVMSAGTGILHSEFNRSKTDYLKLLQIWVFPGKRNVEPRYDQVRFNPEDRHNRLQQIVSPNAGEPGMWIHQDAWFHLGRLDAGVTLQYNLKKNGNGVYAFVIDGELNVNETPLGKRDAAGISGVDALQITANSNAEILLMEVPMLK